MSQTQTNLVVKVLDLLGITQVGQDPSAEDAEKVTGALGPVFAQLASRKVLYVQDPTNIDDEYFNPLAVIVANNIGPAFGQSFDQSTDDVQEQKLREMQIMRRRSSPLRIECF